MKPDNEHNKQQPFGVPSGYFESFQDTLDARFAEERLREAVKDHGFSVPQNYFVEFDAESRLHTTHKEVKIFQLFNTKTVATVAAVAACLVLVLTVFNTGTTDQQYALEDISTTNLEDYLESDAIDFTDSELTAYFDEESLTLPEESIEDQIANDALEDYILDNLDATDIYIQYEE